MRFGRLIIHTSNLLSLNLPTRLWSTFDWPIRASLQTMLLLTPLFLACTTPAEESTKPKPERCYCGPLLGASNDCGLWVEPDASLTPKLIQQQAATSDSCQASDCGRLFKGICQRLIFNQAALKLPRAPLSGACYCDLRVIHRNGSDLSVCAAWHPDSKTLIEYHDISNCDVSSCGSEPFLLAPKLCRDGFQTFYENNPS